MRGDLFPNWPVPNAFEATTLLAITLAILYRPKLLGYFTLFGDSRRLVAHGGAVRAFVSVVLESLMSILLAPILMLFQSGFVISILAGRTVRWAPQQRADEETSWRAAIAAHRAHPAMALIAGPASYPHTTTFFPTSAERP